MQNAEDAGCLALQIWTAAGFWRQYKRVCRLDFLAGRNGWVLYLVLLVYVAKSNPRKTCSNSYDLSLLHTRVSLLFASTSQTCLSQRKTAFVHHPHPRGPTFSRSIYILCAVELHFSLLIIRSFLRTDPPRAQERRRSGYTCTSQAER